MSHIDFSPAMTKFLLLRFQELDEDDLQKSGKKLLNIMINIFSKIDDEFLKAHPVVVSELQNWSNDHITYNINTI